jgi:endonuclease/exonuclease/phosphatase family metal-dependent hydrolase
MSSDRWLPATLFAFGPRWVVLLPLVVLAPAAVLASRRAMGVLAVGTVVALMPLMGLRIALPPAGMTAPRAATAPALRVLSLNALGGDIVRERLDDIMTRYAPDLIAFQECGERLGASLDARAGWYTVRVGRLCSTSRWPLTFLDTMPRLAFQRLAQYGAGGTGQLVRARVAHPAGAFDFVNVHLETARKGLEGLMGDGGVFPDGDAFADGDGRDAVRARARAERDGAVVGEARAELNAMVRNSESERAAMWAARHADTRPVIVAGDFNMPVEASIYREHWGALTNAFDARGTGFGFTRYDGRWLRVRIDHVLAAPRWFDVRGAWVGEDAGSDHLPMVADLTRRTR